MADSGHPSGAHKRPDPDALAAAWAEAAILEDELVAAATRQRAFEQTASWRVTRPLRNALHVVNALRGRPNTAPTEAAGVVVQQPRQAIHTPSVAVPGPRGASPWRALGQRLSAAAAVLAPDRPEQECGPGQCVERLAALLADAPTRPGPYHWLVLVAVDGHLPSAEDVRRLARRAELDPPLEVASSLLREFAARQRPGTEQPRRLRVVSHAVVVDVDFCARHDTHLGIQRVVRESVPRWATDHEILPLAHVDEGSAYRMLTDIEWRRVFGADRPPARSQADSASLIDDDVADAIVVPWRTTVVLPDVMRRESLAGLAALAEFSGNDVSLIGYDMIPIISADLRPLDEAAQFAAYLTLVKHSHSLAAISRSAAAEFRGFGAMLPSQGLAGPVVAEIVLAEDVGPSDTRPADSADRARPIVLAVGRREPHKNLATVLQAAELAWARGLDFELVMLGGLGWQERGIDKTVRRLVEQGRPITSMGWVSDADMGEMHRRALVTVFISLHEGYGLPVSESLAYGTPVITTNYGSQRQIAEGGGCLVVDPRDDKAVADAIERVLTEPGLADRLREGAARRSPRSWNEYAAAAWAFLVEGTDSSGA